MATKWYFTGKLNINTMNMITRKQKTKIYNLNLKWHTHKLCVKMHTHKTCQKFTLLRLAVQHKYQKKIWADTYNKTTILKKFTTTLRYPEMILKPWQHNRLDECPNTRTTCKTQKMNSIQLAITKTYNKMQKWRLNQTLEQTTNNQNQQV